MTKIKIKISKEGVEKGQASGDFEDPPVGLYVVRVQGAEQKQKPDGQYPYLNVQAFPVGKGRNNEKLDPPEGVRWGTVWDRVSLSPAAEWRLTQFCLAMGMKINAKGEIIGTLETEEGKPGSIIGKLALLRVKAGENLEGRYRAEAGGWYPYDPNASDTGEGFDDEEPDEELEAGDDSTEDEDVFGGEEEPEDEDDFYTEESLGELDNDGLKAAAAEFDLDTKDYVVKVRGKTNVPKTRAAIIEAILEAQGVETEDEEPF